LLSSFFRFLPKFFMSFPLKIPSAFVHCMNYHATLKTGGGPEMFKRHQTKIGTSSHVSCL
ncbi:MAG: hypothetical protein K2I15_12300, partial [Bacteroides sp.]|nr:hypothetical protein [Bacteroides sp.]